MLTKFQSKQGFIGQNLYYAIRGGMKRDDYSFDNIALKYLKKIKTSKTYDYDMLSLSKQDVTEILNYYLN